MGAAHSASEEVRELQGKTGCEYRAGPPRPGPRLSLRLREWAPAAAGAVGRAARAESFEVAGAGWSRAAVSSGGGSALRPSAPAHPTAGAAELHPHRPGAAGTGPSCRRERGGSRVRGPAGPGTRPEPDLGHPVPRRALWGGGPGGRKASPAVLLLTLPVTPRAV